MSRDANASGHSDRRHRNAATCLYRPGSSRDKSDGPAKPTIVLVHGAWASSASWDGVITRLESQGYTVDAPPNPLRSLMGDSQTIADYLKTITGPIVLVGTFLRRHGDHQRRLRTRQMQ
jgi:pimeloyl-ACP methyl ester carboxylesterase